MTAMTGNTMIRTHKMRYTTTTLESFGSGPSRHVQNNGNCTNRCLEELLGSRDWANNDQRTRPPQLSATLRRQLGEYPLTSAMASWVCEAFANYEPLQAALELVRPFSAELHDVFIKEHAASTGWHDLRMIELTYQVTLEVGGEILIAATANGHAVRTRAEFHSSRAARDDHFSPWGKLLTGLVCDPPIISQFPFYLMMCEAYGFEKESSQEDYVYSALTGMDWIKGNNAYSARFETFEKYVRAAIPGLHDGLSGKDRSFWRISLAYLDAINKAENARGLTAPRHSYIQTGLDPYLLMAVRGFDTIGTAYMCSDGAAYLDEPGMDSLIGSALPNDVMDLHMDISTGETRNLLRLLYPNGQSIDQTIKTMSTVLSGMLCEIFRGHSRARFNGREDGRIAATSPPYSFSRARHRRIFETLEAYSRKYDRFWDWTWEIYRLAKEQITDAGVNELLVDALHRGIDQKCLPESTANQFFTQYFDMIEAGESQMRVKQPLGVSSQLGDITRDIYRLWHTKLLDPDKKPGWGRRFDNKSDLMLKQAGEMLGSAGGSGITDDVYKFAIAYGRLSIGLPYIAYHAVDAIIMAYGVELC
ncbi:hypothetical protein E4U21_000904 [Claviceps maximensis]|nr:hypothetical protein E4U21_000904 [Claviceps maximensis]